jgi:hypothetical protein
LPVICVETRRALVFETNEGFEGVHATRHVNDTFNTVRIGVNYHFGGPALGGY